VPFRARPHASVKPDWSKQPVRYMGFEPTTSDTEPNSRRVQPQVKA